MLLDHDHTVLHSHPASKKTYTSSTDVFPSDVTPSSFSSATTFSFSSSSPSLPSPAHILHSNRHLLHHQRLQPRPPTRLIPPL